MTVQSTARGLRALITIDSAEAPERYRFPIGGDVASLVKAPDGSVIALDSRGTAIAIAAAPWAVDANGLRVPAHFEVDGTNLYEIVEHDSGNFAYPIVADPWWNPFSWPWGKWLSATWNALKGGLEACGIGALEGVLGVPLINSWMDVKATNINPNVSMLERTFKGGGAWGYAGAAAIGCAMNVTAHSMGY